MTSLPHVREPHALGWRCAHCLVVLVAGDENRPCGVRWQAKAEEWRLETMLLRERLDVAMAEVERLRAFVGRIEAAHHPHYYSAPTEPPWSVEEAEARVSDPEGWVCEGCGEGAPAGGPMDAIQHDDGCVWAAASALLPAGGHHG